MYCFLHTFSFLHLLCANPTVLLCIFLSYLNVLRVSFVHHTKAQATVGSWLHICAMGPSSLLAIAIIISLSTLSAGLSFEAESYILNVFSSNSTLLACSGFTERSQCELTELCYWKVDYHSAEGNNTCVTKSVYYQFADVETAVDHSWCYEFFPLPFIALVFFVAAFISGVSLVGMIYCYLFYDVFSRRLKTGEIVYNQFYFRTWPIVSYCALLFTCCITLAITAWLYWLRETICAYVIFTFIFLVAVVIGIIGWPVYSLVRYIQERCFENDDSGLDLEHYIMPPTVLALPLRANQVRCF